MCIYTDERPDLSRELPSWMFDASYCSHMKLGSPEISVDGLNKLAAFLVTLRKTLQQRRIVPLFEKGGGK